MSASVLYDEPGPRTRRRHRLYGVVLVVLAAAVLGWVVLKLQQGGELDQQVFDDLSQPNIWTAIGDGVVATLKAAGIAIVLSVVVGFLLATGRISDRAWISQTCRWIVEFFRAVPVLLMMIFLFAWLAGRIDDTETRALVAVVGGLVLYNGSVLAEVFRAGLNAVPRGQVEAAYAIGMRKGQVLRMIQTPQAVRFMLPAIISQCVVALKDTSLGLVVTYTELLRQGKLIAQFVDNQLMTYLLIAVIYISMNSAVSALATWLERRMAVRGRSAAAQVAEVEDVLPVG